MAKKVLVVEDEDEIRELIGSILEDEGYKVSYASNGQVAIDLIPNTRPDLILLDMMMPVVTGWQVLDVLRNNPDLQAIPVVIVSAAKYLDGLTKNPPVRDYIPKPFNLNELLGKVLKFTQAPAGCT